MKKVGNGWLAAAFCGVLFWSTPAWAFFGEIWTYLKQYQFGVDYTNSYDRLSTSYETTRVGSGLGPNCEAVTAKPTRERCRINMVAGASSGFGVVLEQAFKRQGLFYFHPDLGFGVRYLSGAADQAQVRAGQTAGLPLTGLSAKLAAVVIKPNVTIGITPQGPLPDLLIALGPAIQVALGRAVINHATQNVAVATSSKSVVAGFVHVEIVPLRFGKGSLSLFTEQDYSGDGEGSKFVPKSVDGMDDIRANFDRNVAGGVYGMGLKILLP